MNHLPSYPKVWQVGHRAVDGLFSGPVIVQEKVDGSQISFAKLDGRLYVRSKGAMLVDGAERDDELVVDGMFQAGVANIAARFSKLPEGMIFRGEYLNRPKHNTLVYDRVPTNHIVIFDASAADGSATYGRQSLEHWAEKLGFDVIPQLFEGEVASLEALLSLLDNDSYLGGPKVEGIVVKNYDRLTPFGDPMFAKYVSEAFKEKHVKDWKGRNPNTNDILANLIEMYRTEPRWQKAVQHFRDDGRLKGEPADIGPLMGELARDLIDECEDEIRDALWKHFGKKVVRGVQGGFAEWYKEQLAASAFDGFDAEVCPGTPRALVPAAEFKLVEVRNEGTPDAYIEQWTCDPPAEGIGFQVVRESWHSDGRVRTIHEVKLESLSLVNESPFGPLIPVEADAA